MGYSKFKSACGHRIPFVLSLYTDSEPLVKHCVSDEEYVTKAFDIESRHGQLYCAHGMAFYLTVLCVHFCILLLHQV